jgi:predicted ATPase
MREVQALERGAERVPTTAEERLAARLRDARTLLVVDNCEHVIEIVADLLTRLLASSPEVKALATSREPLAIVGEALCVLAPLDMPDEGVDVEVAAEIPSVQLFVERAEAVDAQFALGRSNVDAVVSIVRRLDGLPLAIELAAARLRVLPVSTILERLSDRFRLLTGGSRTALPRHRTLRAVVEWSWDLLTERERTLVERLAVFPSGATVDAAVAVCSDDRVPATNVPDALDQLVEKSLLKVSADGGLRYRMLETIREYGIERLAERGEAQGVRAAHAHYFTGLAEQLDPVLRTADQLEALDTLAVERENLLAAARYLGDCGDADETLRLVLSLCWYWTMLGAHDEAARWLSYAYAVDGPADPLRRASARALLAISSLGASEAHAPSTWDAALDEIRRANAELERFDAVGSALVTVLRPMLAFFAGDNELADRLSERALESDDAWVRCASRTFRAAVYENAGDTARMRESVAGSLVELEAIGDRWLLGSTLSIRGRLRTLDGDLAGAIADFEAAERHLSEIGAADDQAIAGVRLAELKLRVGDVDGAREWLDKAFSGPAADAMPFSILKVAVLAGIARLVGDHDEASRLGQELRTLAGRIPHDHPLQGHARAMVMAVLAQLDTGEGRIEQARAEAADAYAVALTTQDMPIVASVGVAVAGLAAARGRDELAAEMLGAAASLRGARDETDVEIVRLTGQLRSRLGDRFDRRRDAGERLSKADALSRLDPASIDTGSSGESGV